MYELHLAKTNPDWGVVLASTPKYNENLQRIFMIHNDGYAVCPLLIVGIIWKYFQSDEKVSNQTIE